jgi:hypothetical protein
MDLGSTRIATCQGSPKVQPDNVPKQRGTIGTAFGGVLCTVFLDDNLKALRMIHEPM